MVILQLFIFHCQLYKSNQNILQAIAAIINKNSNGSIVPYIPQEVEPMILWSYIVKARVCQDRLLCQQPITAQLQDSKLQEKLH